VVAGDRNQLPPTSFFRAAAEIEDDDQEQTDQTPEEPLESLLDDCVAVVPFFRETSLRWHYRSRDERLIKFSNALFYDNQLIGINPHFLFEVQVSDRMIGPTPVFMRF
jgi:superfamily I DNA and/or RNA helicase